MNKSLSIAALIAAGALAACSQPSGPVASGVNSSAPQAVSSGVGGSVGGTGTSGGSGTGGTGAGASAAAGGGLK